MLSLMDTYSGYNHIQMYVADEEKTTFITNLILYCYQAMLFGLKKAGATYQRLVNRMFKEKISKSIKVYMDDFLVKGMEPTQHLHDLHEAFGVLRGYQM